MTRLIYVDVADGTILDTITLRGSQLAFDTGEARDRIASLRQLAPDLDDAALMRALADGGWSNGYMAIRL